MSKKVGTQAFYSRELFQSRLFSKNPLFKIPFFEKLKKTEIFGLKKQIFIVKFPPSFP